MTDIKIVISLLCKHLDHLYNVSLKAESFRLAKFNKYDAYNVKTFWRLLSRMVDIHSENTVTYVKSYFLKVLKYECLHFYSLPEDMSCGSRELLIALAYLIANDFLNNRIQDIISKSVFNPNKQSHSSLDTSDQSKEDSTIFVKQIKNNQDFENMVQWIDGQIEYNKRQYWEYQEAIKKLLLKNKVDTNASCLSELEIRALTNEKECNNFLEKSKEVSKVVHLHSKWLSVQSDFWKWMDSVLTERDKDIKTFNWKELDSYCKRL